MTSVLSGLFDLGSPSKQYINDQDECPLVQTVNQDDT